MPDHALDAVRSQLIRTKNLHETVAEALRQAIDEVIDPARSGRWSVEQLEKVEKTYIGTRVEIILRSSLGLDRGERMDCLIAGHEVDIKFSLRGKWMIPTEAVGELCLLVKVDDDASVYGMGLVRASEPRLAKGGNRDKKRSLNSEGIASIEWVFLDGQLPVNQILHLDPSLRTRLMEIDAGQARVTALFRELHRVRVSRRLVEWAASQLDPTKRVRDARIALEPEGIRILSTRKGGSGEAMAHGLPVPAKGEYVAYRPGP